MRGRTLATVVAVEAMVFAAVVACSATNSSPAGDVIGDRPAADAQLPSDGAHGGEGSVGEGGGSDGEPADAPPAEDQRAADAGGG